MQGRAGNGGPAAGPTRAVTALWGAVLCMVLLVSACVVDSSIRTPRVPRVLTLELDLSEGGTGLGEPLVVTGRAGAADFLYLTQTDASEFTLGYDSWGAGGPNSPSFMVGESGLVRLHIEMPSVLSMATGEASERLRVQVEGQGAWSVAVHSHPARPHQLFIGSNPIGGSSCARSLSAPLYTDGRHAYSGSWSFRFFSPPEACRLWLGQAWPWLLLYSAVSLGAGVWLAWGLEARRRLTPGGALRESGVGPEGEAGPRQEETALEAPAWWSRLPAKTFLFGLVAGFVCCVLAGRWASKQDVYEPFPRFSHYLMPASHFYPTASQLLNHVRARMPKGRILVLVGGASYFRGAGQNPDEVWTSELQRLLGDRFWVVNYAADQAGSPSLGGVIYQILRQEYPDMVYLSSAGPFSADPLDGGEVYGYLYWDAYYKGLLPLSDTCRRRAERLRRAQLGTGAGREQHLGKWLDSKLWAADLWTYVGYRYFFTVWTPGCAERPFAARASYVEPRAADMAKLREARMADAQYNAIHSVRTQEYSRLGYDKVGDRWVLNPRTLPSIRQHYDTIFPKEVRGSCLLVFLHGNPLFTARLAAEDRRRILDTCTLAQAAVESLGYHVIQAGADFEAEDYYDAGHFMASGGKKIAAIVATKVRLMRP